MPGKDTKVDLSLKGKEYAPIKFKVEKAHIAAFAQAVDDPNKLYFDEKYAAKTKYKGIIAPQLIPCVSVVRWRLVNSHLRHWSKLL